MNPTWPCYPSGRTMNDTNAFFDSVSAGDLAGVQMQLDRDPSLASAQTDSGVSAVLFSIYNGRREIRDLLLARGAVLQLHDAAAVGNLALVQELQARDGANVNAFSPDEFPVLALAAVFGHLEVVRYLASRGADINAVSTNGSGYTALTGAVASGHTAIVEWLLQHGANPNCRYGAGYSPLLTAAANGHLEIVKLLLAYGAELNAITNEGKSAIALATERKHFGVASLLQSHSAA